MQAHQELIAPVTPAGDLRSAMEQQAAAVDRALTVLSETILDDVKASRCDAASCNMRCGCCGSAVMGVMAEAHQYQAFGGVKQAIASTAEDVYTSRTEFEQERMRDIFAPAPRLMKAVSDATPAGALR